MDEALHSKDVARSAHSGGPKYPEFPGCHPVRIPRAEIRSWEGRIEFWDADTEIAMVCEPTTWYHEVPGQRLARLAALTAAARGSQIEAGGRPICCCATRAASGSGSCSRIRCCS